MYQSSQIRIATLFLIITIVSMCFAAATMFWRSDAPNHQLLIGLFLCGLSSLLVLALAPPTRFTWVIRGAAVFGLLYLCVVLKFGWWLSTIYDSKALERNALMGLILLPLAGMLTQPFAQLLGFPLFDSESNDSQKANDNRQTDAADSES